MRRQVKKSNSQNINQDNLINKLRDRGNPRTKRSGSIHLDT